MVNDDGFEDDEVDESEADFFFTKRWEWEWPCEEPGDFNIN